MKLIATKIACPCTMRWSECVCVCVCERERERERGKNREVYGMRGEG